MRTVSVLLMPLLLLSAVASTGQSVDPAFEVPDTVQMVREIAYARAEAEALALDLFVPRQGAGPFPGVVFVSCGGWITGAKSQFWRQGAYLAERGVAAATTQCRPAPATRFPAQLNDVVAAVRWLRSHASNYNIDPRRIAVAGASSGGHLAALVGSNLWNGVEWSGAPPDARVQAAVVFNGVLDVRAFVIPSIVRTNLTTFLGSSLEQSEATWLAASPAHHVSAAAAPFLLLHGTDDAMVPYSQSVEMQRRLRVAGVKAELFTADGAAHGFFNQPPWYDSTVAAVAEFLRSVLP
jgi:acetyl esterase/lipase